MAEIVRLIIGDKFVSMMVGTEDGKVKCVKFVEEWRSFVSDLATSGDEREQLVTALSRGFHNCVLSSSSGICRTSLCDFLGERTSATAPMAVSAKMRLRSSAGKRRSGEFSEFAAVMFSYKLAKSCV